MRRQAVGSQHLSTYIHRLPDDVYTFASNPENLPRWAAGLASAEVKRVGDVWVAQAPFGKVRIKFADDARAVESDLRRLKELLERRS